LNKNLELADSIMMSKEISVISADSLTFNRSHFSLAKDFNSLYISQYFKSPTKKNYSILIKVDSLRKIELFKMDESMFLKHKSIEGEVSSIIYNTSQFIDTNKFTFCDRIGDANFKNFNYTAYYYRLFNDFYKMGNDYYIVGQSGLIEKVNLENKSVEIINEQTWLSEYFSPIQLNDGTILFKSGSNSKNRSALFPYFYLTRDLKSFWSSLDIRKNPNFDFVKKARFYDMEYDIYSEHFNFLGQTEYGDWKFNQQDSLLYSTKSFFSLDNKLETFEFRRLEPPHKYGEYPPTFFGFFNLFDFETSQLRKNCDFSDRQIMKLDTFKYWVNYLSYYPVTKKDYTSFTVSDRNYQPIFKYNDSSFAMDFVFLKSFNNFIVHCANTSDSGRSEIRYTTDKGENWNYVHKYEYSDTLQKKYYLKQNNTDYLFLIHFDGLTNLKNMYLDVVDLNSNTWKRLSHWDLKKETDPIFYTKYGICSHNNVIYLSIGDTLYYINDIYNKQTWKYRVLPDKGNMLDPISIISDKFISNYINKFGNFGLSIISFTDSTFYSVDEVERKNYLYSYPPYPNPATNEVNAMIYWDLALNINSADIKIYDIYGKQVADKTSTTLEEQGPYYGKLTWHCKGVPPGVYLVNINYGTEKKTIKVCVVE
jgi:hypothetical protein